MTPSEHLAFARELADLADTITLARFGGPIAAVAKPDGSPVTEADKLVEAALRERIAERFSAHAVLGEEEGGAIDPSVPTWVIDPIDGTANFLRGLPMFATLIGLIVDGRSVIGVASAPAMGERWEAADGLGAWRNRQRIGVSRIAALSEAHVLHGGLRYYREAGMWDVLGQIADRAWRTRGLGDYWMHLLVAGGMADVGFELGLQPWDVVALECIVTEAGGRMTSWTGGPPLSDGSILTTNGRVHDELSALLAPAPS